MTWLYVGLSLGAPISLAAVALRSCKHLGLFPIVAAIIWSIAENGRMWSFALTTWAPSSLLGAHFSVASIGYPLTENKTLLQLAHPLGIDALNFFTAFVAGQLAIAPSSLKSARVKVITISQALLTILLATSPLLRETASSTTKAPTLRFAVISENIAAVRDPDSHEIVKELLLQAAQAQPPVDVVLLPEEFSLTSIFWSKEEAKEFTSQLFGTRNVLIVHSRNEVFPAEDTNSGIDPKKLVYESTNSGELGRYVKLLLMPLGEYAPAFTKSFFSLIDDPELQMYLDDVLQLPPPGQNVASVRFRGITIGGLLCSDILSPRLYRKLSSDHQPDVLINLANQFWFHGSRMLHFKTLQLARVHAVQNRVPFLMANNMAPSFALNPQGAIISQSSWMSREVIYIDIPPLYLTQ